MKISISQKNHCEPYSEIRELQLFNILRHGNAHGHFDSISIQLINMFGFISLFYS